MQTVQASLAWLTFVLICGLLEFRCGHTAYDYRASAQAGCTTVKGSVGQCLELASGCFTAAAMQMLSPRSLSTAVGDGGPLLTWLPILASTLLHRGVSRSVALTFIRTLLWFLAVIGMVRHLHLLLGWDPSGHLCVYAAQLIPMWQVCLVDGEALHLLVRAWLVTLSSVLFYLSAMTAIGFHTLSETAAAAALAVLLALWVGDRRGGTPSLGQVMMVAITWALPTLYSWALEPDSERAKLLAMLLYDLACWAVLVCLMRMRIADEPGAAAYHRLCGVDDSTPAEICVTPKVKPSRTSRSDSQL